MHTLWRDAAAVSQPLQIPCQELKIKELHIPLFSLYPFRWPSQTNAKKMVIGIFRNTEDQEHPDALL